MTQKPDFGLQPKDLSLFQGLIENEGRSYNNWGLHRSTRPAVYVEPITYADVQASYATARASRVPSIQLVQCCRRLPHS